ncbi:XRE family transcriptional regulator [Pseudonocardiaceae bacterium YIM PH 21723]|nr:XRE family transcriptional regulator [Pseudonocardiaceae bacterium YIM PH 21723]
MANAEDPAKQWSALRCRRALAGQLRHLRALSGLKLEEVTAAIGKSGAAISRWEARGAMPSPEDITALAEVYQAQHQLPTLLEWRIGGESKDGWFQTQRAWRTWSRDMSAFAAMEDAADEQLIVQNCQPPGLFQTRDTARQILASDPKRPTSRVINNRLDLRMDR